MEAKLSIEWFYRTQFLCSVMPEDHPLADAMLEVINAYKLEGRCRPEDFFMSAGRKGSLTLRHDDPPIIEGLSTQFTTDVMTAYKRLTGRHLHLVLEGTNG